MGNFKEKLQKFIDNPDVAFKEQMGYVSGVFGNCMGQDSVSTYTDQFMYDYMGLKSSHMVAMKSTTTAVNILIAPIVGAMLDNNRSGKGNARNFMMASAIPFTLASVLLFVVPYIAFFALCATTPWTRLIFLCSPTSRTSIVTGLETRLSWT